MKPTSLALWILLAASAARGADNVSGEMLANWPSWRGPLSTGIAPAGKPPLTWDEQTNVKWKVPIPGNGDASPIVWNEPQPASVASTRA